MQNSDDTVGYMPKLPNRLWLFLASLFLLDGLSLIAVQYFQVVRHLSLFPYTARFLPPGHNRGDFTCFADRFAVFHQADFFGPHLYPFNYPAPVAVVYWIFYGSFAKPEIWFRSATVLCILAATVMFAFALRKAGISTWAASLFAGGCLLTSYPFALAVYLDNMELVVWVVLAAGLFLLVRGYGWQSAVLIGLAGSLKYYPVIFLAIPLASKRYKDVTVGVAAFALSMLVSLWYVGPSVSVAYHGLAAQMPQFTEFYVYEWHPILSGIDHSLYGFCKVVRNSLAGIGTLRGLVRLYLPCSAAAGIALWWFGIRKLPLVNQILALSVVAVLLPVISHDYTLIHLYAPFAMLVLIGVSQWRKGLSAAFACFAVLFTTQDYLVHHDVRYGGQLKALTLIVLLIISLRYAFEDSGEARLAT